MRDYQPIEVNPIYLVDYDDAAGIDMDQALGDVAVFSIPHNCSVWEAGVVVTEACAGGTTTPVLRLDKRSVAGSDAGRGDGDIGELKLLTSAQGKVMYDRAGANVQLEAGNEVVVQLTVAAAGTGAAGHVRPYLSVIRDPEVRANMVNKVATT